MTRKKAEKKAAMKSSAAPGGKRLPKAAAPGGEVDTFMRALDHPLKPQLESLRRLILGVDPAIVEGIKWNAPSFRTTDWFATTNVHAKGSLRLILHTGAKAKQSAADGMKVADPAGLLKWLAKDRALVTFNSAIEFEARRAALEGIIRAWICYL
ncbi:MAG: DUF1801 domain-containing protein [Planctomycetota bacterium]